MRRVLRPRNRIILTLLAGLCACSTAPAQSDRLQFSLSVAKAGSAQDGVVTVDRGHVVQVTIKAAMKPGFHSYPLTKQAPGQGDDLLSSLRYTVPPGIVPLPPIKETEPVLKEGKFEHQQDFVWTHDLLISADTTPGRHTVVIDPIAWVCDENCVLVTQKFKVSLDVSSVPPAPLSADMEKRRQEKIARVRITVGKSAPDYDPFDLSKMFDPKAPKVEPTTTTREPGITGTHEEYKATLDKIRAQLRDKTKKVAQEDASSDLLLFVLLGMLWGGISLITPCVFPMIPITVSFFLKQSEKEHNRPLLMAGIYSGTIILVLTLAAVAFLEFFRTLTLWPITNWIIGALFVYFALSLLGMYEIELPSGLARFTSAREGQGGYVGVIFMALTFTIISFACVAPFLGGFAGTSAKERPLAHTLLGALAFATTFAAPFFFLALFPAMLKKLPKSGSWLNTIKVVMGFLELAAAIKFFRSAELLQTDKPGLFTFDFVLGVYVALALLCGLYLLNLYRLPHDTPVDHLGVPRLLFAIVFLALAFHLAPGLLKTGPDGETQRPNGTVYAWVESFLLPEAKPHGRLGDLEYAIETSREHLRKTGKPKRIFVDCTGFG